MSPADILFYTGIRAEVFEGLEKAVGAKLKSRQLGIDDQLLLTLMRLRLGLLYEDLSRRFDVSVSAVGSTFARVLKTLEEIMKYVVLWLPRSRLRASMPSSFVENGYGRTTCISDCTEVTLQRPRKLMARAQTFSAYKANNTAKFLTVIAPNGLIMFVSKVYGGRASDKTIVMTCGVEDHLLPGDEIMADKGFTLDTHLEAQGISLNMPAFTKGIYNSAAFKRLHHTEVAFTGKDQLTEEEVTRTRRIACVRIHVERAINRIKTYRIFKQPLSIKSRKHFDSMVFVCAGLCNLKALLIKEA
ncbi:uncharacterized protein ISCGN_016350 [Ixodes scapularis]